ncbi:MAG: VCBS repeat-containing protein [Phycisphaerales bacterium]
MIVCAAMPASLAFAQMTCEGVRFPHAIYTGGGIDVVHLADLNGDGRDDLITSFQSSLPSLNVRLAGEHGYFGEAAEYGARIGTSRIRTADFDGDGHLDILVGKRSDVPASIFFNLGDGAFGEPILVDLGGGQPGLDVADVNGDGTPDIVVCGPEFTLPGEVRIFPNDGQGGFGAAIVREVGGFPTSVALGDFDGDGHPDIVTANTRDNTISVLLNGGNGLFSMPGRSYSGGFEVSTIELADINGDGTLDIVLGSEEETFRSMTIFPGLGNGRFAPALDYPTAVAPRELEIADLSGDGILDVVVSGLREDNVAVLLGRGDGIFEAPRTLRTPEDAAIAVGDADGDGVLDLAIARNSTGVVLGDGAGGFRFRRSVDVGFEVLEVAAHDLDGDGDQDIVAGGRVGSTDETIELIWNDGGGRFRQQALAAGGAFSVGIVVDDFTGDGLADIATRGPLTTIWVLPAIQPGQFGEPIVSELDEGSNGFTAGDLNGDGLPDLAFLRRSSPDTVAVMFNLGGGAFGGYTQWFLTDDPNDIAIGDIDEDGNSDVVLTLDRNEVAVLRNLGGGSFADPQYVRIGREEMYGLDLHDADGDGDLDLFAISEADLLVARNDGAGGFPEWTTYPAVTSELLKIVDVNLDGFADAVIGASTILLGDSEGGFSPPLSHETGGRDTGMAVADMDGDGKPDLIAAARDRFRFGILYNETPCEGCRADFDGDGALTIFDFLAFQNAFDAGDPRADFDADGELTLFDFLVFLNEFQDGCG